MLSSLPHGIFSKLTLILRHKASLNRHKKIEIRPSILSDHHGLKVYINNNRKFTNSWKLSHSLLNKKHGSRRNKEVKDFLELNEYENEYTIYPNIQDTLKSVLRGKFIMLSAYIKNKYKKHLILATSQHA